MSPIHIISDSERRLLVDSIGSDFFAADKIAENLVVAIHRLNTANWDEISYTSIAEIQRNAALGLPTQIRGSTKVLGRVTPRHFDGAFVDTVSLTIEDVHSNVITSATISDSSLIRRLVDGFHRNQVLDFYGCPVLLPVRTSAGTYKGLGYNFLLADIDSSEDPLQMIQATPHEIEVATATVKRLAKQDGAILAHIRSELIRTIGIKAIEKSPKLDVGLTSVILQALSDGYDSSRSLSHRIHTLVVGSPAVGKKLLAEAIRITNPVSTEGHPAKITVAGVAGRAVNRDGQWTSEPGLIPQAHRGAFIVQDFHHVKDSAKKELMGVFSMVMEDGKVIDSTAARQTHNALTSIHLDLNKVTDLYPSDASTESTKADRVKDIGLSMNVITRFDIAIEIPRDVARQIEIGLEMHIGAKKSAQFPVGETANATDRKLKVLVAFLRSRFAEVEISADLAENHIRTKQRELLDTNRDRLDRLQLLGDYQTRLANSVNKLVFAIARSNARAVATKADADFAFQLLASKLEFLATLEAFNTPESWTIQRPANKVDNRRNFIIENFSGKDVTPETILNDVRKQFGNSVSLSTIRRDLNAVSDKPKHGSFRVREMTHVTTGQGAQIDETETYSRNVREIHKTNQITKRKK